MYNFNYTVTIEIKGSITLDVEQDFADRIKEKDPKTIETMNKLIKKRIEEQFANNVAEVKGIEILCKD